MHEHPNVDEIVVVCSASMMPSFRSALAPFASKLLYCNGGDTRAMSVKNGVLAASSDTLLIHDGARPNASSRVISSVIHALHDAPVVIPAIPVTDTIKTVCQGTITGTVDRDHVMAVQTPQGFHTAILMEAYRTVDDISVFTDEASLMESLGVYGAVVPGCVENIKVTYPSDMAVVSALFEPRRTKDSGGN